MHVVHKVLQLDGSSKPDRYLVLTIPFDMHYGGESRNPFLDGLSFEEEENVSERGKTL